MNKLLLVACIGLILGSCQKSTKGPEADGIQMNDTIETPSGLKYYYKKKGEGKKVAHGSAVTSYLSLMVGDKVVWNTDAQPDSLFTYFAGNEEVIIGFEEMGLLLREGDEVVTIIPSNLAYGEGGAGEMIPPNSTIVYNEWKVKKVGEPRLYIADTLFNSAMKGGIESAMLRYNEIASTQDSINYHLNQGQFKKLWRMLSTENMHEEAFTTATYFGEKFNDTELNYYAINSLENMGEYEEAIKAIDLLLATDPTSQGLNAKKAELKMKLVVQ